MVEHDDYFIEKKNPRISLFRILSVSRRVLKQITRDRRTFAMMIVMPLIIMFIFGVALSGEVKHTPILIDNQDKTVSTPFGDVQAAKSIIGNLSLDDRVSITKGNYQQGVDGVEASNYTASILFPANFSQSIINATQNPDQVIRIIIYLDATKPQIRLTIMTALQDAIKNALNLKGINIETHFAYGGVEFSGLETGTPGVMGFVLTFLALLLSLLILIREQVEGTQIRLFATPLTARERLLGYMISLTIFALLMAFSILAISILVFQVPVEGSLLLLIAMAILFAIVNVSMAVLLANFVNNELQAVQMAPLTALPSMALSGMLVPVSTLPAFIQPLSKVIPLTYAIKIFEGIMLKGYGVSDLLFEISVLVGIALGFTIIAILTVSDKQE